VCLGGTRSRVRSTEALCPLLSAWTRAYISESSQRYFDSRFFDPGGGSGFFLVAQILEGPFSAGSKPTQRVLLFYAAPNFGRSILGWIEADSKSAALICSTLWDAPNPKLAVFRTISQMFDDFSAFGKKSLISRIGYFSSKISREFAGIAGNPRSLPDVSVLCRKVRNCAAISQKLDGQEDRLVIACKKSPPSLRRISRIKNPRTALYRLQCSNKLEIFTEWSQQMTLCLKVLIFCTDRSLKSFRFFSAAVAKFA